MSAAHRTRDDPACPAGILAAVNGIESRFGRSGADAELFFALAPRLSSALLEFPAVYLIPLCHKEPLYALLYRPTIVAKPTVPVNAYGAVPARGGLSPGATLLHYETFPSFYVVDRDLAGIDELNKQYETAARRSCPVHHEVAIVFPEVARDAQLLNEGLGSGAVEVPAEFIQVKRPASTHESVHDLIATA